MGLGKRGNHVVPKSYIEQFGDERSFVTTHFVDDEQMPPKDLPATHVGKRKSIYLTEPDADGIRGRELEDHFGEIETKALPLLKSLDERWPIDSTDERGKIAEYLAIQLLRTPAWLHTLDRNSRASADAYQAPKWVPDHIVAAARKDAPLRRNQFDAAMGLKALIGTMFASMRWTLLRTSSPLIASSDQPLVAVPFDPETPTGPVLRSGIKSIEEVRLPISCERVLLLDWYDALDGQRPATIPRDAVRTINFATIEQADIHWFHRPKRDPPRSHPRTRLANNYATQGYNSQTAYGSERRTRVLATIDQIHQSDEPRDQISILHARPAGE